MCVSRKCSAIFLHVVRRAEESPGDFNTEVGTKQKTRLQINIDLLTLFPASDFLPLPKQHIDIIYFLGNGRFCNCTVWARNTTAYLLTGPHLGSVTSPLWLSFGFSFFYLTQKWKENERTKFAVWPIISPTISEIEVSALKLVALTHFYHRVAPKHK